MRNILILSFVKYLFFSTAHNITEQPLIEKFIIKVICSLILPLFITSLIYFVGICPVLKLLGAASCPKYFSNILFSFCFVSAAKSTSISLILKHTSRTYSCVFLFAEQLSDNFLNLSKFIIYPISYILSIILYNIIPNHHHYL